MTTNQALIEKFWNAVFLQDYEMVRKYIAEGFDVNARIPGKAAPITIAQTAEDMVMLKILWAAGVHPATPWLETVFGDFANGGDGTKFKAKKERPVGKLILHRYNGDEEFVLEEAVISIEPDGDNLWLILEAETNGTVVKSLPDTEPLNATPSAYLSTSLKNPNVKDLSGLRVSIKDSQEDNDTTFYYVEHQSLQSNEIEFISKKKMQYMVKWKGLTTDVNNYDGSVPPTSIEIEGWFTLKKRT